MKTLAIIIVLLLVAGAVVYLLLEKRPGYGAWYGLAKLTGSPLDIGPVDWATLTRHDDAERRAGVRRHRTVRMPGPTGSRNSTRCRRTNCSRG